MEGPGIVRRFTFPMGTHQDKQILDLFERIRFKSIHRRHSHLEALLLELAGQAGCQPLAVSGLGAEQNGHLTG
ncbi:hypothetical protein D3C80_1863140 [compost metagenome]